MKKTIYILTTRSFKDTTRSNPGDCPTLFNPGNCTPLPIRYDQFWYQNAFPHYFTDIIQFLDLNRLQREIELEILDKLPDKIQNGKDWEKEIDDSLQRHVKIYLKKQNKKERETKIKKNKKDKTSQISISTQEFEKQFQKLQQETAARKDDISHRLPVKINDLIDQLKNIPLKQLLFAKSKEQFILQVQKEIAPSPYDYSSIEKLEEISLTEIAVNHITEVLHQVVPEWWFTLVDYKNKCIYLDRQDAFFCYTFMQEHCPALLKACDKAHQQNNDNQFTFNTPLYKYNTPRRNEDWYIVECFDMRTDPDFGLTYLISLMEEIQSYYSPQDVLNFRLLIHDYDIGRKLIRSSVRLKPSKSILKEIKKAFAEKEIESILVNERKVMLSASDLIDYYQKEKYYVRKNAVKKIAVTYPSALGDPRHKAIQYLDRHICQLPKAERIIVFKHNKGEIAHLLKEGSTEIISYYVYYKQNILDMLYELIRRTDNLMIAYSEDQIAPLSEFARTLQVRIRQADDALDTFKPSASDEQELTAHEKKWIEHKKKLIEKEKDYLAPLPSLIENIRQHLANLLENSLPERKITENITILHNYLQSCTGMHE